MRKAMVVLWRQEEHTATERRLLASVDHPAAAYVVRMLAGDEEGADGADGRASAAPTIEEGLWGGVTIPLRSSGPTSSMANVQEPRCNVHSP